MRILIATGNKNKFKEISEKFKDFHGLRLISPDSIEHYPDVIEDGETFEQNAVKKAKELFMFSGMPVLADDSGLEVEALDNRPGVYSARYGDPYFTDSERNMHLLEEMKGIKNRGCRFVCVMAIVDKNGTVYTARGECSGSIAESPGGQQGFGYDPVFYLPEYGKTMAEIPLEEKNRISHRARALDRVRDILPAVLQHDQRKV